MSITRRETLGLIGAIGGGIATAPRAFAQAQPSYDLVPRQVGPGIWMIEGATEPLSKANGGATINVTLLEGSSGMIVIDTGPSYLYGQALNAAARQIDLRGVSTVLNTHHHPENYFGNQIFADLPIYGLEQTLAAARITAPAFSDALEGRLGEWLWGTEPVPPQKMLERGPQYIDGRSVEVFALAGHTAADLAVFDRESGTLIAGDLVFLDHAPATQSADLPRWQASLDLLETKFTQQTIPGHGPLHQGGQGIAQTRDYLTWLEQSLREQAEAGRAKAEVKAHPLPERFAAMGAQPEEYQSSVTQLFGQMAAKD